jgi:GntR family transcriptional regulator
MSVTSGTPILLPEMGPLAGKGVVERMRSIGVAVETWVEIPRPALATQEQASLLSLSAGDLVLSIERTYYDGDGRPVETADIIVPDRSWEAPARLRAAAGAARRRRRPHDPGRG